jgi:DNA phosphorothioation-associated putative methyltransferase
MDFRLYRDLVRQIPVGKQLPDAIYLHESALDRIPPALAAHLERTIGKLGVAAGEWNIVKFFKRDHKVALLHYPTFFEDAYPALHKSVTIDLEKVSCRTADYSSSENPPILHRKEAFLQPEHLAVPAFRAITDEGEKAGLYENSRSIGFKKSWERLISRKGYLLDSDGRLQPKCNGEVATSPVALNGEVMVERHLTAIDRDKLSAPMQALARHNYLNGNFSVLDYGCGKGDDLRELEAHGIDVSGWDPIHRPNGNKTPADIVNLGYVVNVIEDRRERDHVVLDAFGHTDKVLAVSAMVAGESTIAQFTPYKDGVITSRNTFQKYYSQSELRTYLETTLDRNAIAVSPGIFFVFRDEIEEQVFLSERQHSRRAWTQRTQRERQPSSLPPVTKDLIARNQELFDDFWQLCLDLGRLPANDEFEFTDRLRALSGSHAKAFAALIDYWRKGDFDRARVRRRDDLLVYFALGMFGRRRPYRHMPDGLQRDVKAFFGGYKTALESARKLLFSVGNPKIIADACEEAYRQLSCGVLNEGHSLIFHRSLLNDLPAALRVYVGCATQLYGDIESVDLVKIHMTSGKVSLQIYDDFNGKPLPLLKERIKIKLREQGINFFDYGNEYEAQPLYFKSRYLAPSFARFSLQSRFDKRLAQLLPETNRGFGPPISALESLLEARGLRIRGFLVEHLRER